MRDDLRKHIDDLAEILAKPSQRKGPDSYAGSLEALLGTHPEEVQAAVQSIGVALGASSTKLADTLQPMEAMALIKTSINQLTLGQVLTGAERLLVIDVLTKLVNGDGDVLRTEVHAPRLKKLGVVRKGVAGWKLSEATNHITWKELSGLLTLSGVRLQSNDGQRIVSDDELFAAWCLWRHANAGERPSVGKFSEALAGYIDGDIDGDRRGSFDKKSIARRIREKEKRR